MGTGEEKLRRNFGKGATPGTNRGVGWKKGGLLAGNSSHWMNELRVGTKYRGENYGVRSEKFPVLGGEKVKKEQETFSRLGGLRYIKGVKRIKRKAGINHPWWKGSGKRGEKKFESSVRDQGKHPRKSHLTQKHMKGEVRTWNKYILVKKRWGKKEGDGGNAGVVDSRRENPQAEGKKR